MSNELITLAQKPIIEYSEMEARGLEVAEKIGLMNLDMIEANESNRSMMKKARAQLNNELEVFEDQRKMIHAAITKPYKDFTESYEKNIKTLYVDASAQLKEKIVIVEAGMMRDKTADIEAYFNTVRGDIDFLTTEKIGLNIILSASDKKLRGQVDSFMEKVHSELVAINGMENSIRVQSLYKTNLDLSLSVSTVNSDIEREKKQEAERVEQEKINKEREAKRVEQEKIRKEQESKDRLERKNKEAERIELQRIQAKKNAELNKTKEAEMEAERLEQEKKRADEAVEIAQAESERIQAEKEALAKQEAAESKIHSMNFKVAGTIKQLKEIKLFLENIGVEYE